MCSSMSGLLHFQRSVVQARCAHSHGRPTFCCSMMCGGTKSMSRSAVAAAESSVFALPIMGMLIGMDVPCRSSESYAGSPSSTDTRPKGHLSRYPHP